MEKPKPVHRIEKRVLLAPEVVKAAEQEVGKGQEFDDFVALAVVTFCKGLKEARDQAWAVFLRKYKAAHDTAMAHAIHTLRMRSAGYRLRHYVTEAFTRLATYAPEDF